MYNSYFPILSPILKKASKIFDGLMLFQLLSYFLQSSLSKYSKDFIRDQEYSCYTSILIFQSSLRPLSKSYEVRRPNKRIKVSKRVSVTSVRSATEIKRDRYRSERGEDDRNNKPSGRSLSPNASCLPAIRIRFQPLPLALRREDCEKGMRSSYRLASPHTKSSRFPLLLLLRRLLRVRLLYARISESS